MPQDPKPVMSLIRSGGGLDLIREATRQASLKKDVVSTFPLALQEQVLGCALRKGVLTIDWSSSAAANLARFQAPLLMDRLNARSDISVREVRMRTRPPSSVPPKPSELRRIPGADAIQHLSVTAEHLPAGELSDALRRLAGTLKQKRRKP